MNEFDRSNGNGALRQQQTPVDQRALYDRFGAMAYGVILQILPQTHLAQEALLQVFTSTQLASFSNTTVNPAISIIRVARSKALELKGRLMERDTACQEPFSSTGSYSPESVFDLSFRQGYSFEVISEQSGLSKPELLKAVRDFIHVFRRS
ncbi:hypothetical protein [Larkinella rosea]|uniref:Sigma-70 family RNA polymerase sigma factor n=1 Tax=Larkinella rosea TaxID=2025312 RepID=A0A3P1BMT9_9BACT|nr:hypothetical protein [Larkinella rosea]RRB02106.1 hypothetical protein EHT25_16610 [Larkinella rosea]